MISGFGGSGKSSLSVLLGITGAHHLKSFLTRDVPCPFSTLIMNQEDTMDQLRLKASAYKKHFKLTNPVFQEEIFENTDQNPKIQTKNRPKLLKSLYYRPRSVNTDHVSSTAPPTFRSVT